MDIDLNKLNHLHVVARARSFSRAAEELKISQPALSRSIASLERGFGFRVFERGRMGVVPTAIGVRVLAEAEEILRSARLFASNLRLYGDAQAGDVTFGCGPLVASLLLPDLCAHILAKHPHLQVQTSIKAVETLFQELLGERIEMMFANVELIPSRDDLLIEPIAAIEVATIVRANHPLAAKPLVTREDLNAYPLATATEQYLFAYRADPVSTLMCENYDILQKVVLRSDAIWVSSPQMVADDLAAGRLVKIDLTNMPVRLSRIGVIRLRGRTTSPAAQAITDEVKRLLVGLAHKTQA